MGTRQLLKKMPDCLLDYCYYIWHWLTTDDLWPLLCTNVFYECLHYKPVKVHRPPAYGAPQPGDDPVTRLAKSGKSKTVVSLICIAAILFFVWGMVFVVLLNLIALNWAITLPSKLGLHGFPLLTAFANSELKSLVKSIPVYFNQPEGKIGVVTGSILFVIIAKNRFSRRKKRRELEKNEDRQNTSTNEGERK